MIRRSVMLNVRVVASGMTGKQIVECVQYAIDDFINNTKELKGLNEPHIESAKVEEE